MQDDVDVHRVALAWRAWDVLQLTGQEYAHTLLRQASLITSAFHTAGQAGRVGVNPYPFADQQENMRGKNPAGLLDATEAAIQSQDQASAAAATALYGELGHSPKPMFDLLLKYAVSQDGALHAEKYYQTVSEEFTNGRAKFRWNHLIGLARVTASEYGWPAPGHEDAARLLIG